jgi:SNF2 family DNA or RNA helicase
MIILHGGMLDGQLWLWGEVAAARKKRRKPRERVPGAPPPAHPLASARAALLGDLIASLPGFTASGHARRIIAWLPTANNVPCDSNDVADEPMTDLALRPWLVGGIALESPVLLLLLRHLITGEAVTPEIQIGADLAAWVAAFRFALALVARGRILPDAQPGPRSYEARWNIISAGRDAATLAQLARNLPGACRALSHDPDAPPALPAQAALISFLNAVVDALLRDVGALEVDEPVPAAQERYMSVLSYYNQPQYRHTHDRWLLALGSPTGRILGGQADLPAFAAQVQTWRNRTRAEVALPFRFCLRLEEPYDADVDPTQEDAESHPWRLCFLLQAQDDPSLLIDAEEIWRAENPGQMPPGMTKQQLRQVLLAGLGRAAQHDAALAECLRQGTPSGIEMDLPGAFRFLTETATRLEAAGCVVLLPSWWARSRRRVKLRAHISSSPKMVDSLQSRPLITFDWKVAIGNAVMSHDELQALAQLKAPLVQVRGRWVQVNASEIQAALDFWKKQAKRRLTLGDAARLAFDEHTRVGNLEVERVEVDGWLAESFDRLRQGQASLEMIPPPDGLRATLRPYQQRGYAWLRFLAQWGLGACLADDMGLGKAHPLDAKILTPTGWKRMGEMKIGDPVINSQGGVSHTTGVFPQGEKDIYRVEFTDGSSTECCDEHLWYVNTALRRQRGYTGRVLPLSQIGETLKDSVGNNQHFIPMVQPIEFEEGVLPLHPYLIGALLGDGNFSLHYPLLSSGDQELLDYICDILPEGAELVFKGGYDWRISAKDRNERNRRYVVNPVTYALRALGLAGHLAQTKFIPDCYKFASVQSRIALLRGLMDTDGSISNDLLEFSSVSLQLCQDVQFLVQSLGGVARLKQKKTTWTYLDVKKEGLAYRLIIAMPGDINPFRLKRKAELWKPREKYQAVRAFKSVTFVGRKEAQCIAVDAPDHLYVTDECIVTHNTVQVLALLQYEREHSDSAYPGPTLVICPTSVVGNWKREAQRFTPDLPVMVHHGGDRRKDEAFIEEAAKHAIVISSYALLHRDREILGRVHWRGVVLDEAQNIKNSETKQAQAAASLNGGYRIALTGTPVENSVGDLWSLMDFLNPGLLGSAKDFKESFFLPIQSRRDPDATARLKRLTGPFLLRRVKTDPAIISDLPEKLEMNVFCTLTKEQASLYAAVLRDMEKRIDEVAGMERRGLIFATLTKLKQICNHPVNFLSDGTTLENRSGKLARLEAMLEEAVAEGDHALVFTQYAEMGKLLHGRLAEVLGREVIFLSGATPKHKRDEMIERFQGDDGPPIFVLSLKAGGLGLNLTRANHVFHYDRWWNPAVENQATDRAFRIGQQRAVQVHKFICAGTLEERIADLIESKQELAAHVVGSGEGWLTELSTEQLRDLFSLRADALEV